jgi:hypothetical protein
MRIRNPAGESLQVMMYNKAGQRTFCLASFLKSAGKRFDTGTHHSAGRRANNLATYHPQCFCTLSYSVRRNLSV